MLVESGATRLFQRVSGPQERRYCVAISDVSGSAKIEIKGLIAIAARTFYALGGEGR